MWHNTGMAALSFWRLLHSLRLIPLTPVTGIALSRTCLLFKTKQILGVLLLLHPPFRTPLARQITGCCASTMWLAAITLPQEAVVLLQLGIQQ
jgi:hypothetical protein